VAVMISRSVLSGGKDFLGFFKVASLLASAIGLVLAALCWAYFASKRTELEPASITLETQESLC
jgi:hypothetical protein